MCNIDELIASMHAVSLSGNGSMARQIEKAEKNMEAEQILETLRIKEMEVSALRQQACDYFKKNGYPDWEPDRSDRPEKYLEHLFEFEKALYKMDVCYVDKILKIRIPAVLPHKKYKPEPVYFKPFGVMLEKYIRENPADFDDLQEETRDGATVVVRHSYKSEWLIRDNDNFEIRSIINILHSYQFILTDNGSYLDIFLTADGTPSENQCEILVMSKYRFQRLFFQKST